jgi:protein-tyrosine phosphatase
MGKLTLQHNEESVATMRSILFVCTANICRSPTGEGIFKRIIEKQNLHLDLEVASAGTHQYHVGKPPYPTAVELAKRRGYDITSCLARQIKADDFDHFDMILAMDKSNLVALRTIAPTRCKHKIELLLDYSDKYPGQEVPDPYGGDEKDFERALDMIEDGCKGLAELVKQFAPKT